jgi:hypothetical protein
MCIKTNIKTVKNIMSYDLLSYKEARIEALLKEINRLELENEKLTTYVFELCDKDCPDEYKKIVKVDVFKG